MDVMNIVLLISFGVVMYFFFLLPQRRQQKQRDEFFNNLKNGDSVVTIGGLCGRIYKIDDTKVIINTYDNMKLEFLTASISIEETMKLQSRYSKITN
jgi:preprotein translocase subunit YajC